jgi:hypothetical protein
MAADMSEDHFRIIYDGPAVDDGEMEVGQLAPSLLAFGKLVESLDVIVSGETSRVRVKVRADVQRGSFDIGLSLDFVHSVKAWILSPTGGATLGLLSLLGLNAKDGVIGLIQGVRWLKGRRITKKITLLDGNVSIETDDGAAIAIPAPVVRALEDETIRQHLERFTEPLRNDGVEIIRFDHLGERAEVICADEAPHFEAVAGSDPTSSSAFRATYQIKRLYFERGKKWRLSSGAQTIMAEIQDPSFWDRVERSEESFAKEDYLVCLVRMDQWLTPAGLRTEYVVEEVVDHMKPPRQDRFPGT